MQSIFSPSICTLANKIPLCISLYCTVLCSKDLQRNMSQMLANNEQYVKPPDSKYERKKLLKICFLEPLCLLDHFPPPFHLKVACLPWNKVLHSSENYHSQKVHQMHLCCIFKFSVGCYDCIKCELHKYDLCFTCSLQPVSPPFPVQACTLYNHHN